MTRRVRLIGLAVVVAVVAGACSIRTAGSPTGDMTLVARFDDVQHLVAGHTVRLADVPVGTVTSVKLDGYDAVVEMSISDNHEIPEGTRAAISATSLLGENFVRLERPDTETGEFMSDGEELTVGGVDASFEEITVKLLSLMRAIQGDDIATVINESHTALAGRGADLNKLIGTVEQVSDGLVTQTDDLVAIIDSLAKFGDGLVGDSQLLGESIEAAADATGSLAGQRDRMVQTVDQILTAARTLDEEVLAPHTDQLEVLLDRLAPTVDVLTSERDQVIALLHALNKANRELPVFIDDDGVGNGYVVLDGVGLPGGTEIPLPELLSQLAGMSPLGAGDAVPADVAISPSQTVAKILFGPFEQSGTSP